MNQKICHVIAMMVLFCLCFTVFIALLPIAPYLALIGVVAWLVIRRPFNHPNRISGDIGTLAKKTCGIIERIGNWMAKPFL